MRASSRFVVSYNCPHCGAALQAEDDGWDGWRRCPSCGLPAVPPKTDPVLRRNQAYDLEPRENADGQATAAVAPGPNGSDPERLFIQTTASPVVGTARLIFKTGFILSLALLLISYLDQKSTSTVIFAILAVAFCLLLLRFPMKRP
jgi:hypothetical protein